MSLLTTSTSSRALGTVAHTATRTELWPLRRQTPEQAQPPALSPAAQRLVDSYPRALGPSPGAGFSAARRKEIGDILEARGITAE
jgi:hypothetical protein